MTEPHDLSYSECEALLRAGVVGRVALSTPTGPQILPVNDLGGRWRDHRPHLAVQRARHLRSRGDAGLRGRPLRRAEPAGVERGRSRSRRRHHRPGSARAHPQGVGAAPVGGRIPGAVPPDPLDRGAAADRSVRAGSRWPTFPTGASCDGDLHSTGEADPRVPPRRPRRGARRPALHARATRHRGGRGIRHGRRGDCPDPGPPPGRRSSRRTPARRFRDRGLPSRTFGRPEHPGAHLDLLRR